MLEPTVIVAFVLNFIRLIINGVDIYCLQVPRGGNAIQKVLLQNLSSIELIKVLYDYFSYFLFRNWHERNSPYLDIAEMRLRSVYLQDVGTVI